MHLVATIPFELSGVLLTALFLGLNALCFGAFAFTNVNTNADDEMWTFTSLTGDTTGAMTYKNSYGLYPVPLITDTSAQGIAHNFTATSLATTGCTITQVASLGAGSGVILVHRRR